MLRLNENQIIVNFFASNYLPCENKYPHTMYTLIVLTFGSIQIYFLKISCFRENCKLFMDAFSCSIANVLQKLIIFNLNNLIENDARILSWHD
jgi:hypothetical protein